MIMNILLVLMIGCFVCLVFFAGSLYGMQQYKELDDEYTRHRDERMVEEKHLLEETQKTLDKSKKYASEGHEAYEHAKKMYREAIKIKQQLEASKRLSNDTEEI